MVKGIEIGNASTNGALSAQTDTLEQRRFTYRQLSPGDAAPWFTQQSTSNPNYVLDTAAGRWIVLALAVTASDEIGKACQAFAMANTSIFNDSFASLFLVSQDPQDKNEARFHEHLPGVRVFWDFDGKIAQLYGVMPKERGGGHGLPARRMWIILDPTLRVKHVQPFEDDGSDREKLSAYLQELPAPSRFANQELQAPILYLPDVFEQDLCAQLIALYQADGGAESGFMREVQGKTVMLTDPAHKRRRDFLITDPNLIGTIQNRILRRIVPEIKKVHQFQVTRMERYIVGCYRAEDAGHFRQHRDNTTSGTAHRRFAVSINLNSDFDGGQISFPEYGPRQFKPEPGSAVVFSCSLLHAVSPVTRGDRYAFLPFLYDDAAAALRESNNARLGDGVNAYNQTIT
ncbi:MAG: peroxiredoxin [Alphaproteobacteria bacterium PA3]|nr:MAG: peroxiredoxin [Alphaproteobacteria bacterium PA3]